MSVIKGDGGSPIDPRVAEIDRLRAELASRQIDIDTFREGNQKLRAELATQLVRTVDANARAERAEAEWDAMREALLGLSSAASALLDEAMSFSISGVSFSEKCMGHKGPDLVAAAIDKVRAVLAPSPAGREG